MKQLKFDPHLTCPFCGINSVKHDGKKYVSMEHIPPKCIFVEKSPNSNLITIPSCEACNNGTSQYDIEFKLAIGIHIGNTNPKLWESTRASLKKDTPSRKKRQKEIIATISPHIADNGFGFIGQQVPVDVVPVKTVVSKICKGLHWQINGNCLPPNCVVDIKFIKNGAQPNSKMSQLFKSYGSYFRSGNGAFEVNYVFPNDRNDISIWRLWFYGVPCFEVDVSPNGLFESLNEK